MISDVVAIDDTGRGERLLDVFGLGIRHDDPRFVVYRTGREGDEDVAFDCGWEDTEQGIVDVFTDQAIWVGAVGIRNDAFGWLGSMIYSLDSPRSSCDISRISTKASLELFRDSDPFPPVDGRLDRR